MERMHRLSFTILGVTMADKTRQFPLNVTIKTPMHTPMLRGNQARGPHALGPLGANLRVRVSRVDHGYIEHVSAQLGMKPAAFVRWCAVHVAKELLEVDE